MPLSDEKYFLGFLWPVQWERKPFWCSFQKGSGSSQTRQKHSRELMSFITFKYFPVNFISCTPGADSLSTTVTAPLLDHGDEESLNTPQIYCTEAPPLSLTQPTTTTASTPSTIATSLPPPQPVILKVQRIFQYKVFRNVCPIRCSPAVSRHSNQLPPHP